jgi:predicted nucleic acid-binding protein
VEAPVLDQQICRDPHDDKFIACALAVGAGVIVSGDKDLLSISGTFDMLIITPREFVNSYIRRGR